MVNFIRLPQDANLHPTGKPYWHVQILPSDPILEEGLKCHEEMPSPDNEKPNSISTTH